MRERGSLAQLYLFMSIIFLSLLARVMFPDSTLFIDGIYACMSTPVVYTMSYYMRQAGEGGGEFVRRRRPEPRRAATYEAAALLASYMVGYFMFYAMTGAADLVVYTVAYAISQTMRAANSLVIKMFEALGLDPSHPLFVFVGSGAVSLLHLPVLLLL